MICLRRRIIHWWMVSKIIVIIIIIITYLFHSHNAAKIRQKNITPVVLNVFTSTQPWPASYENLTNADQLAAAFYNRSRRAASRVYTLKWFFEACDVCLAKPIRVRCWSGSPYGSRNFCHCGMGAVCENVAEAAALAKNCGLRVFLIFYLFSFVGLASSRRLVHNSKRNPSAGGGRKVHRGGKILRFSTEIAVYLGNCTR